MDDRASATAFYNQHIEDVKAAVPADRLLVFSADQGWKPLCGFLGVPEPEREFPNVNDRAAKQQAVADTFNSAYRIIAGIFAAIAASIYAAFTYFG